MSKKSVLGHPENSPHLSREGFSLDQQFTFTASVGHLLPVWYDLLNPGETVKGSPSFLIRTENFLAPAMADVDIFCDVFFVPMQKILSSFGEWFYQINDIKSDYIDVTKLSEYLPITFDAMDDHNPWSSMTAQIFNSLSPSDARSPLQTQYVDSFGFGLHRLLFHFGLNPQSIFYPLWAFDNWQSEDQQTGVLSKFADEQYNVECPNFCPYLFAAYQGIYYDYYRNSEFEGNEVKAYNLDSVFANGSQELDMSTVMTPYPGSRRQMFELRYRWRSKDYFMATRSTPLINGISMLPDFQAHLAAVNQWLTTGIARPMRPDGNTNYDPYNQPQNSYTQFGLNLLQSTQVGIQGSASLSGTTGSDDGRWKYSDSSDLALNHTVKTHDSNFLYDSDLNIPLIHDHSVSGTATLSASGTLSNVPFISTARIRTMFALEKLARITQRSGKHYDDQTLAHFGYKVNKGLSGEVYKIGSYHTMLGIQKVTSTADTQGAALGEQAGVGFGLLDGRKKKFEFTAPCHGIVMCIWSAAPRYKYVNVVDKLGLKTKLWDYYKPYLDNLGSQPLFGFERIIGKSSYSAIPSTAVVGWQWRFMESKVKYNRVAPVFVTTSKNPWSMVACPDTPIYEGQVSPTDLNDLLNAQYYTAPAWPAEGSQQSYHTWVGNFVKAYLRDPFVVDFKMDCSKVSTMSTFGDVSLNGI